MEIWKDIIGFETSYQVSNFGNVKSKEHLKLDTIGRKRLFKEKILSPFVHNNYLFVSLYKNGELFSSRVHRLVCDTFIKNELNKSQINHINGIKTDNRVENLEWCTPKENIAHAILNNLRTSIKGEKCNLSKLTENQVLKIKNSTEPVKELANKFNISIGTIYLIKKNKIWKHL